MSHRFILNLFFLLPLEFIQRKADFPLSWLPIQWLQNHPRLNCDVFLIISTTSKQDNGPFTGFGGMLDLLHVTEQIGPASCYKQVHLSSLSQWDKTVCMDTWTEEQCIGSKIPDNISSQVVPGTIHQPITLRFFTALVNRYGSSDGLANLKDCTLTTLFHTWFTQAEMQFGQPRVQFVMRHLVAARWGLDDEDVLTLYRQHANMQLKSKSGMRMAHRQSIQAANLNQSLAIMLTHQPAVTSHWWSHFRNTYLMPIGLLAKRRNPPEGSSTLWYLRQQVVEELIRLRYLDGPSQTMTYHTLADWCQQDMHGYNTTMPSSLGWRCLHELPVYLSKSDRKQHLRNACWFNPIWLKGLLYIALELRGVRGSVQRLLDEIAATLYYLNADKWEAIQLDLASQQTDVENTQRYTIDRHVPVILKLISEDTELLQLFGALCSWKNQLQCNPTLLNSLFYTQFYNTKTEIESKPRDTPGEEQEGEMGIEEGVRRSDLRGLVDRIRSEPKNCILQPVNFQLNATLGSLSLIGENLTSAVKQTSLCYSQTIINVDALTYTTDGDRLALGIRNTRTCVTKTEVWSLKSNVVCWSQVMEARSMNKICQLNWVSDHALLVVHSPSQVITLWPVEISKSTAQQYWQLSDVVTGVHEEVSVRIVNTEVPEVVFILILQLGLCRVNVWRWSYGTLEFVHSSVTLVDSVQMPNYQSPSNVYRHMSLPMVAKSSSELLFTAAVTDAKLQFVCAHKHESAAKMTSFELKGNPLTLNFKNISKQRMLKCPCKGTRIIAMETTERGPIVLASRAPSLELPGEPVVGCLDLFDLTTGNFLNHVEAGSNVFAFAEAPSLGYGLLTQSTPNQLRLLLCKDGVNLLTVAISSGKKNNQCFNKELIHWNLISRVYKLLDQSDLLLHISATPSELPAPLTASICNMSRLSLCFGTDAESRCLVWHCDPSHAIVRPAERSRPSARTNPEMWQDLQTDSQNPPRLFYLFRDPDQDVCLGLFQQVGDLKSLNDCVTFDSWYTKFTFPVIAHKRHSAQWEVYQSMEIFELVQSDRNKGNLQLEHRRHLNDVFIIPCDLGGYFLWNSSYLVGLDENRTHFIGWSLQHGRVACRMKPNFVRSCNLDRNTQESNYSSIKEETTTEQVNEKQDLELEENVGGNCMVEKFLLCGSRALIVVSYGLPYLCIFSLNDQAHVGNLDDDYAQTGSSQFSTLEEGNNLNLTIAALSFGGHWLALSEFSKDDGCSCLTVWSLHPFCKSKTASKNGFKWYRKRLTNQSGLIAVRAEGQEDCTIISARLDYGIFVWRPCQDENAQGTTQRLEQSERLEFYADSLPLIELSLDQSKVAVAHGLKRTQITVWLITANFNILIGHVSCPTVIDEVKLTFREQIVAIRVSNQDKPLLVWPKWQIEL
ncbi:hypothetical protein PHET_11160 [Paragonimus heterotremus]|uniref:RAVE complex protein Rav1 C-terminal domain-containing protein n=1 Tax=Paragonimus heterotremus TaxID=100268 RepID=A0A8J4SG10_9TREM|nr:hypothetical protein PHET_11160 [Paragonimus heterotremus]